MWTPRPYQHEAIEAGLDALAAGEDTLLVLPVGAGKSGIIGTITKTLFQDYGLRIVSCAHVKELVEQSYTELVGIWSDWCPAGIYSAGLGRKELHSQILFAGIQSIFKKAHLVGNVDVLMIDEVHTLPPEGDGQYRKFISDLREINPDMRLLGLTATPYRLGHGRIDEPREKKDGTVIPPLFEKIAYEVSIRHLIDEGWLAPLRVPDTALRVDMSGVKSVSGDYNLGQMSEAVDKPELIRDICADIVDKGVDRRSWLIFTPGKSDARHFHEELQRKGFQGGVITDETSATERARLIADFKAYRIRYLVNCGVLTTGFDHKGVDLIAMVRATKSAALYIQICGRGTRPLYVPGFNPNLPGVTAEMRRQAMAVGPKANCLVLDYSKNIDYHGPVDLVQPRRPGKGGEPPPMKTCPNCEERLHASARVCGVCDHEFTIEEKPRFQATAAIKPILSRAEPVWTKVTRRNFARHSKWGSPDSLRVEYWAGMSLVAKEWWAFESEKGAWKAGKEWKACGGAEPAPKTVSEAIERISELRPVDEIRIEPDGKFWKITGRRNGLAGHGAADEAEQPASRWAGRYDVKRELDEEIPF